ncbi:oligosaccharide flippase family protein [Stutzerimonas tarimensis]|uniref:Oligosaccharide flippase family protein n=1 Tax=Stutzerimonas tarimensis TaxID=1507735 RepID=A0ABV7T5I1_9GAMM
MILRNSLLSLSSLAIPLLVGLLTVPLIIEALGLERFGVLTLVWAVIGYASLFDLGISRALTKRVAELHALPARLRTAVRSGIGLMLLLGLLMGLLTLAGASLLDHQRFGLEREEHRNGALLLALSVPLVIVGGGLRGALEGLHRFGVVSAVRLAFGLVTFIAPVYALQHAPRLDVIIAIMLAARILGLCVMGWACRAYLAKGRGTRGRRWAELRRMLTFGGWVTVSNLVSAVMLYLDRFVLAAGPHAPSLAYYTTPYEFVTKLFILPSALSGVLFPLMARSGKVEDAHSGLLTLGCSAVLVAVLPVVGTLVLFSTEILQGWISPAFGEHASLPLRILSLGVLVNCLAQIYQTYLLGRGKAFWMARLHLIELILFLPALYLALRWYGIAGVAWVWTLRVVGDALAMGWMLRWLQLPSSQHWLPLGIAMAAAGVVFGSSFLGVQARGLLAAALWAACALAGYLLLRHSAWNRAGVRERAG